MHMEEKDKRERKRKSSWKGSTMMAFWEPVDEAHSTIPSGCPCRLISCACWALYVLPSSCPGRSMTRASRSSLPKTGSSFPKSTLSMLGTARAARRAPRQVQSPSRCRSKTPESTSKALVPAWGLVPISKRACSSRMAHFPSRCRGRP